MANANQSVLILGDSLSAAYGMDQNQGWVALLQKRLDAAPELHGKPHWSVVNASISGETSAGGLARLPELLERHRPDAVVIALGSNDGLQGKPPALLKRNLLAMVRRAKQADARVLVIGNRIPPNYGQRYTEMMFASFGQVAEEENTALIPFLLESIAQDETRFQADRLHPTAEAQAIILDTLWPGLLELLKQD